MFSFSPLVALVVAVSGQGFVSETLTLRHTAPPDVSKRLMEEKIPHGIAIKADLKSRSITLSGKPQDVRLLSERVRRLDVQPTQILVSVEVYRDGKLLSAPQMMAIEGMACSVGTSSMIDGQDFLLRIVPSVTGRSLGGVMTISVGDTLLSAPAPITADCSFELDSTGEQVSFETAGSKERRSFAVPREWRALAGFRIVVRLTT